MPNYRPMFEFDRNPHELLGNAQVFASYEEALRSAQDRFARWTMPTGYDVHETDDPVTYRWDPKKGDVRL